MPQDNDWIVFFDDDFDPDPCWLETVSQLFSNDPGIACVNGHVIAGGINDSALAPEKVLVFIAAHDPFSDGELEENGSPYGSNMPSVEQLLGSFAS